MAARQREGREPDRGLKREKGARRLWTGCGIGSLSKPPVVGKLMTTLDTAKELGCCRLSFFSELVLTRPLSPSSPSTPPSLPSSTPPYISPSGDVLALTSSSKEVVLSAARVVCTTRPSFSPAVRVKNST